MRALIHKQGVEAKSGFGEKEKKEHGKHFCEATRSQQFNPFLDGCVPYMRSSFVVLWKEYALSDITSGVCEVIPRRALMFSLSH